jgi:hypothetical protein
LKFAAWCIRELNDVKKTGKSQRERGVFAPEKRVSAFKTISFLVSSPENESGGNFFIERKKDEGNHAQVPDPRGDWQNMPDGNTDCRKNPVFPNIRDEFSRGICVEDFTMMTVPYSSAGEKTLPASLPPDTVGRDISQKKTENVKYPGRSVLYSGQFRPFNRITSADYKKPRFGGPWTGLVVSKPLFW